MYPFVVPYPFYYWFWSCPQCVMQQSFQNTNISSTACEYCSSCTICNNAPNGQPSYQMYEEISDDVEDEEPMWELTPEALEMFAKSELKRQENKRKQQQSKQQKRKKQKQQHRRPQTAYVDLDNPQDAVE